MADNPDAHAVRDAGETGFVSPAPLAKDRRSADWRDLPGRTDPLTADLSGVIGGPVGRHAVVGRSRFFTPMRAILLLAIVFLALGWFAKAPCIQQAPVGENGVLGLDWSGSRQYVAMCYSDTVPLYGAERLNEGAFPYKKWWEEDAGNGQIQRRYMEYPVISGLYQYGAMTIAKSWDAVHWLPGALQVAIYFNVVALGLALAWLVTVWASALLAGRRIWDAALIAGSPLVIVHAFTNFDPLATAFAAGGLLAWSRKRPVLAGILLGLGGAAKLYPLLLLGPLLVLCLRTGKVREWSVTALTGIGAWLAVNLPIALLFPHGWAEFFRLNSERGADPDSVYNVISSFTGWTGFDGILSAGQAPTVLNAVSFLLFAVVCVGIGYIALTAPRRPRLIQLCFLLVAGFLLTNKVWSPQYSLWLVPLAVLAFPHRRILLAWMTIDALVWVPRMLYYLGVSNKGLPEQWFTAAVVVRDVAVVVICALIIRQIYRPDEDLVRYGFIDDPAGGVLDQATDAQPRWLPAWLRPRQPVEAAPAHSVSPATG
ncbi:glycosyltransferase family 87 protein [Rhodococcus opacus]|uniref:Glycosyltransferase family 87 protein n=1 Tax=Rhodococcus opacus TaxID=37919 RepID=A0AAX3YGW0_RHOOP|nr:glycosyltransferase family 87 protein [Rhodococcus opacus]MCZ4583517.1 glycosyltransferase family 87 protein [Rhodococcus opacus]WLF47242.1 glycosyltransferase family 87 protein [Rhodococcus opacus]